MALGPEASEACRDGDDAAGEDVDHAVHCDARRMGAPEDDGDATAVRTAPRARGFTAAFQLNRGSRNLGSISTAAMTRYRTGKRDATWVLMSETSFGERQLITGLGSNR
jgi:hypothetical protein